MRILAIGIGGAGGRIVNQLYRTDRRSSKVACVQALAVDVDAESIGRLTTLPGSAKLLFPPVDMTPSGEENPEESATIDIAQITGRVQTLATGETDAIIFFVGLGGGMADTLPHIIAALRSSVTEPIFALVTIPCLSEGARISSKAADDIETIAPMLDGVIIFDNETWNHKLKPRLKKGENPDEGIAAKFGLKKRKEPALSPREQMYALLNDAIVRRISLILRAGEFRADGGLDLAEVVLDAGEVLNTMRGMGFITIGYAVEQIASHPLDFLARLRPTGLFSDEENKKASRIVDLAKQAIYQEISAPCDITSAHKALILIAGPSHEISMKGFMTVRKWIDRSIAGLETRSGDYPVMTTKFIAIIIMLSGLENIPRIGELKEIRAQYRARASEQPRFSEFPEPAPDSPALEIQAGLTDDMIVLPSDRKRPILEESAKSSRGIIRSVSTIHAADTPLQRSSLPQKDIQNRKSAPRQQEPVPTRQNEVAGSSIKKVLKTRQFAGDKEETGSIVTGGQRIAASENDRRRIEQELLKQRRLAVQGMKGKERTRDELPREKADHSEIGLADAGSSTESPGKDPALQKRIIVRKTAGKTVVIHKKTVRKGNDDAESDPGISAEPDTGIVSDQSSSPTGPSDSGDREILDTWIRQISEQKKDPDTGDSMAIEIDESPKAARDDALLHTNLKRARPEKEEENINGIKAIDSPREMKPAVKKRDRTHEDEDLSWVE